MYVPRLICRKSKYKSFCKVALLHYYFSANQPNLITISLHYPLLCNHAVGSTSIHTFNLYHRLSTSATICYFEFAICSLLSSYKVYLNLFEYDAD